METNYFCENQSWISEIDEENHYLEILLKIKNDKEETLNNTTSKDIFVLIDKSGSMAGSYMNKTKEMAIEFVKFMFQIGINRIKFIVFDSKTYSFLIENGKEENFKYIKRIEASGGTNFSIVLLDLAKELIEYHKNVFVVMLTDGKMESSFDTKENYKNFNLSIQKLIEKITLNCEKVEFHTLGVSKEHDPMLLDKITKISKNSCGTYQYISTPEESKTAFENVCELIKESTFFAILKSKKKNFNRKIFFNKDISSNYESTLFLGLNGKKKKLKNIFLIFIKNCFM